MYERLRRGLLAAPAALAILLATSSGEALACILDFSQEVFEVLSCGTGAGGHQTVDALLRALDGITEEALAGGLPPAGAPPGEEGPAADGPEAVSPAAPGPGGAVSLFGVFASGQWARTDHDGFTISNGTTTYPGPSFTAEDFSAAISIDFNAAKHFGFDSQYGLNIGVFGGYASVDVDVGTFAGFPDIAQARNESAMAGAYALYRKQLNYLLVAGMGFLGETDVAANFFGQWTGEYDTEGFAVAVSAGRIFLVSDRVRFDLRGGIVGARFTGDAYADSLGAPHGASKVSFGAVKFEPGIYTEMPLGNGMVISPYLRGEIQQRFGYSNTVDGVGGDPGFWFDDADLSVALSSGFNLKVAPSATVSAEVRGKASADSSTLAGKIGLKVAF